MAIPDVATLGPYAHTCVAASLRSDAIALTHGVFGMLYIAKIANTFLNDQLKLKIRFGCAFNQDMIILLEWKSEVIGEWKRAMDDPSRPP